MNELCCVKILQNKSIEGAILCQLIGKISMSMDLGEQSYGKGGKFSCVWLREFSPDLYESRSLYCAC